MSEKINGRDDIDALAGAVRGIGDGLDRVLMRIFLEGAVSLQDRQYLQQQIVEQLSAALCFLRLEETQLFPRADAQDLDQIDRGGFVRTAADILKHKSEDMSDPEHEIAGLALQRLYLEHMKLQTRGQ